MAMRHLLYAGNTTTRLRAIEAGRQQPKPWVALAPDRTIVAAAVLAMTPDKQLTAATRTGLKKIVKGDHSEFAVMAKPAQRMSNSLAAVLLACAQLLRIRLRVRSGSHCRQ